MSYFINLDSQLEKAKVIIELQEQLPVETLFNNDFIAAPTILYKVLRDYLL